MKDSLYSLLALQEIDKEIDALVRSKEEFPVEIGRLNEELDAARGRIDETENQSPNSGREWHRICYNQ